MSARNKTLSIEADERTALKKKLLYAYEESLPPSVDNQIIVGDGEEILPLLPHKIVDLLILDPPYNLNKNFGVTVFKRSSVESYTAYLEKFLALLAPLLKDNASIYICGDWLSSLSIYQAASQHFHIRNRITWQREKGRGAKSNWKNAHEDIWFCTMSDDYCFNLNAVKMRRKVIAPYRENGQPKDWQDTEVGKFRDTHPANFWDDVTVPYWSMAENTPHPTQKPEKLMAKLILASSHEGDLVLDPFLGSGTSAVVAKKLGRNYIGIESDEDYALLAQKRLERATDEKRIQGYQDGIFWERNTLRGRILN